MNKLYIKCTRVIKYIFNLLKEFKQITRKDNKRYYTGVFCSIVGKNATDKNAIGKNAICKNAIGKNAIGKNEHKRIEREELPLTPPPPHPPLSS